MEKKPNILLILTDQQRRDSIGAYGCGYPATPTLDALAAQGTRYDCAYCNAPVCTPSRASILTGKRLSGHGVYNLFDILPEGQRLLPAALRDQGYYTGLVGKLHVSGIMYESQRRNPGDGFDVYELSHEPSVLLDAPQNAYGAWLREHWPEDYRRLLREGRDWKERPARSHFSAWVSQRSAEFIRRRDREKPFFLSMGYFDPHSPYDNYPRESEGLLREECRPPVVSPLGEEPEHRPKALEEIRRLQCRTPHARFSPEETEQLRRGYFAAISFLDSQLALVMDALREEGIYDDTLIIFSSDHGDMICDHDLLGKGAYFYEGCTAVPLIVKYPGQREGRVERGPVQLNDIFATAMYAAGAPEEAPPESIPLQRGPVRDIAVCEYRGCSQMDLGVFPRPVLATMIRGERYKLNLYHDTGERQLFDLTEDPEEQRDLSCCPEYREVMLELVLAYLAEKARSEYRENASRGGLDQIPPFSKLKQRIEERMGTAGAAL